jgi:hypothetical protein
MADARNAHWKNFSFSLLEIDSRDGWAAQQLRPVIDRILEATC